MKKFAAFLIVIVALLATTIYATITGTVEVTVLEFLRGLFGEESDNYEIVKDLRFPRIIVALFAGACLSVAGLLLQAVMRNPLADAGIIGISAGSAFVQTFILTMFPMLFFMTPVLSFIGGAIACLLVFTLSWKSGLNPLKIILVGIAISAMFTGLKEAFEVVCSFAGVMVDGSSSSNLTMKTWQDVHLISTYGVVGLMASFVMFKWCNLLQLEDKTMKSLGFNVVRARITIAVIAVLLAAMATSTAGVISFVGLLVPHIARRIVGTDHKILIPFTAMSGALLILVADTLGRTLIYPSEMPASTLMAIIGGPFLIFLIRKDK